MDMVEKTAKAIYDGLDPLSGDSIGTVIVASEHLFPNHEHLKGNSSSKAHQLAAMDVCRAAARAAVDAAMEPTPEMLAAAVASGFAPTEEAARGVWWHMHHAALTPSR